MTSSHTAKTAETARILDGKATAAAIKAELTERVAVLKAQGITPGLGTILVGSDPGSTWYVGGKHKDCAEVGITSIRRDLPEETSQDELLAVVRELNENPECTGYIVQLPAAQAHRPGRHPGGHGSREGRRRPAPDEPGPARGQRQRTHEVPAAVHAQGLRGAADPARAST